ncbi:MAG: tyrosine-type recombinase/integrase, partial [Roseobacter sp.]
MPRVSKELSALEVKRLVHPGSRRNVTFSVGGVSGLMLQITPSGGRSWLLRTMVGEKRRELGLGGFPDVTLAMARERAREMRDQIWRGIDPIAERKQRRSEVLAAQRRGLSFAEATERFLDVKLDAFKNAKHRQQWRNTLETYAFPELGDMLVEDIGVQDVLRTLKPIWTDKTETATRLRQRIENVLSWSTVSGHRKGDNPAAWRGNLKELLPDPNKVAKKENQPALQLKDATRWYSYLRDRQEIGYRALEWTALTTVRSETARGALWSEIDLQDRLWIIPASRIKAERELRVPLSKRAMKLLNDLPRFHGVDLVFPSTRGSMLAANTMNKNMKAIHDK